MELTELQELWQQMSLTLDKQTKLSRSIIVNMTRINYRNRLTKIIIPELIGSTICFTAAVCIAVLFSEFSTWYLKVCGALAIATLLLLPFLSIFSVRLLRLDDFRQHDFKDAIALVGSRKKKFLALQKWSFYIAALLVLAIFPVLGKLMGGKDFFLTPNLWYAYVIFYPFFYAYSRWIFARYARAASEAQQLLIDADTE